MEEEKTKMTKEGKTKKIAIIVCACVLLLAIVAVIVFNVVTVKTLKCSYKTDFGQGVVQSVDNVDKFRFGEPVSFYSKQVYDLSGSSLTKEEKEERISGFEEGAKSSCKKENGCKYSAKREEDKLTLVYKTKHTKEGQKEFWEKYKKMFQNEDLTYEEFVEIFEEMCEANNK